MFTQAYKAAFQTIKRRPLVLWGYALLAALILLLTVFFSIAFLLQSYKSGTIMIMALIPAAMALNFLIQTGMSKVYLVGLEGKEPETEHFLSGFQKAKKVIGAMFWQSLWALVWVIVAIVGFFLVALLFEGIASMVLTSVARVVDPWDYGALDGAYTAFKVISIIGVILGCVVAIPLCVIAVIKGYSYSFVPFILATKPDVTVSQSLKLSMELTRGKKLHMFLADLIFSAIVVVVSLILVGLCWIPFANIIFFIVAFAFFIVLAVVAPVFTGLYRAEFFRLKPMPKAPRAPKAPNFNGYNGGYGAPQQGYGAPQQGYGAPQQGYGAPQQGYGAPQQGYGAPQQGYGAPQQGYGAPQQNYNQNNQ